MYKCFYATGEAYVYSEKRFANDAFIHLFKGGSKNAWELNSHRKAIGVKVI